MMADLYKPHVSGVTHYISLSKRHLEAAGHKVFVFTFGDLDYEDEELRVIRSPGLPISDTGLSLNFRYSTTARRRLQSMEVVHVHHPFLSGRLALRYCKPLGIPILFTNHTRYDLYAQAYLPFLPDQLGHALLQAYLPRFAADCDLVIAPSAGMEAVLRKLGVTAEIVIVPNGVELEPFYQPPRGLRREQFGLPPEGLLLAYVGRLGPEKNLPFLLTAFAGALDARNDLALMLAGAGPEVENLKAHAQRAGIADRVFFLGMVPYADLPGVLSLAEAFVTASVTEVHPLSVLEAQAAGLPVLGIDSPGISDIVQDGYNGLLSHNHLASFTAQMVRMVLDESLRQALSANARESSRSYAIQRTTSMMLEHYHRVASRRGRRQPGLSALAERLRDRFK